jgi:phosphoglycerol transferase MdoB-like AlkP superfamily enzyme
LHGYNGAFYERNINYKKFGFDSLLFRKDLRLRGLAECHYGFEGICDSTLISFMDSLLTDSVPKFIYWTTLDAHPPYELAEGIKESSVCQSLQLSHIDCTYFTLQQNSMQKIAKLAQKHSNYRFIIRGDHRPMGSIAQASFVQSFYFKWVPLIVLNR